MFRDFYQVTDIYALKKINYDDAIEITELKKQNKKHLPFLHWIKTQEFTVIETKRYIEAKLFNWYEGIEWTYSIMYNTKIIGDFQIRITKDGCGIEIGYWIDYRYRLQNIMSTIVNYIIEVARNLNLKAVIIISDKNNIPSIKLALKLFFEQLPEINQYNNLPGLVTFIRRINEHSL